MTKLIPAKITYSPKVYAPNILNDEVPTALLTELQKYGVLVECHNVEFGKIGANVPTDKIEDVRGIEGIVSVTDDFLFEPD